MAVGDRIKRARNLRGMTQKELGIAIGFEEKSADIRIAQYESNTRTPKEELLRKIAEVLPRHPALRGHRHHRPRFPGKAHGSQLPLSPAG